jgi:hypothetical protein
MESSEGIGINDIIGSTISDNKADVRGGGIYFEDYD